MTVCVCGVIGPNLKSCTLNSFPPLFPPPGPGFATVTATTPACAYAELGTVAVIDVAVIDPGESVVDPKFTVELERKLVPVNVNVSAVDPTCVFVGDIDVSVGLGLFAAG